jgi:NTE family protein
VRLLPKFKLKSAPEPEAQATASAAPAAPAVRSIALALQGGGAHGAYQWGVLDRILEDDTLDIRAITGASAGAMNAVALAAGMVEDGPEGARARLASFWRAVSQGGGRGVFGDNIMANMATDWFTSHPAYRYMEALSSQVQVSPYDFNPLNLNPLRDILREQIDFRSIREHSRIQLYIAATAVRSGEPRLFQGPELTAEHVLASGCLPDVFQAVEIEGQAYWDGGYLANPPLWPLMDGEARDVLLCMLIPLPTRKTPRGTGEILERLTSLSFNASIYAELRGAAVMQGLIDRGQLAPAAGYAPPRLHAIGAEALGELNLTSKFNTDWSFLQDLKKRGRAAAEAWLSDHSGAVGVQSSLDLKSFL